MCNIHAVVAAFRPPVKGLRIFCFKTRKNIPYLIISSISFNLLLIQMTVCKFLFKRKKNADISYLWNVLHSFVLRYIHFKNRIKNGHSYPFNSISFAKSGIKILTFCFFYILQAGIVAPLAKYALRSNQSDHKQVVRSMDYPYFLSRICSMRLSND